jgi:hypothetical protein
MFQQHARMITAQRSASSAPAEPGPIRDEPHVREGAGQLRVGDVLPDSKLENSLEDSVAQAF